MDKLVNINTQKDFNCNNLNYDNNDYIDIVTIVRTLDCIINNNCDTTNACNSIE